MKAEEIFYLEVISPFHNSPCKRHGRQTSQRSMCLGLAQKSRRRSKAQGRTIRIYYSDALAPQSSICPDLAPLGLVGNQYLFDRKSKILRRLFELWECWYHLAESHP